MKFVRILEHVLSTETQAIAIYEAEIFIYQRTILTHKRREQLRLFKEILLEEKQHQSELRAFLETEPRSFSIMGSLLGGFLSLLPNRLSRKAHVWAEAQAALIYSDAYQKLLHNEETDFQPIKAEILNLLVNAAAQERKHSERFK